MQTVVRGKDVVNLLWIVIPVVVAGVDVGGTVILKVESVSGCCGMLAAAGCS